MTYYELFTKAENLLNRNQITLGEYEEMVEPLNEEVRKEGRWTNVSFSIGKCSECGFSGGNCYVMNYCPNCGTKMKGERYESNTERD